MARLLLALALAIPLGRAVLAQQTAQQHIQQGDKLHEQKNYDAAIAEYREALRLDPNSAWAHNELGIALHDKGDLDAAIAEYREALRIVPNYLYSHYNLGNALKQKGDLDAAVAEYHEALRINPNYFPAHYNLGNTLTQKADLDAAIDEYRQALRIDPNSTPAHSGLGNALHSKGDLNAAIAEYREALRLTPDYSYARNNLDQALREQQQKTAATAGETRGSAPLAQPAHQHILQGDKLHAQKNYDAAISEYREALRLDPNSAWAHNDLGNALQDKGDLDAAIAEYREALRITPNYAYAHNNLGNALYQKGDLDAAVAEYHEALRIDPNYHSAHYNLGNALYRKGDLDAAVAEYREALRLDPSSTAAHAGLGNALHSKRDLNAAIAEYREALRLTPDYSYARNNLDQVLREQQQKTAAVAAATRGFASPPKAAPAIPHGSAYALIIGIDEYRNFPKLHTAANDAREIAALLREQYGFSTTLLLNADATRYGIMTELSRFRQLSAGDSLLIYYAGHGYHDPASDRVYWLPADAVPGNSANSVLTEDITSEIKAIPAQHILVISDSCYAGGMTRDVGALFAPAERKRLLEQIAATKSRLLLASGRDEPVADSGGEGGHSVFAAALIKALKDVPADLFTGDELFVSYVRVAVAGNSTQVPVYSFIQNSGHSPGGDFIFYRVKR